MSAPRTSGTVRIARLTPSMLEGDRLALYNEIAGGRRALGPQLFSLIGTDGALEGPFNAFLLQPQLGRVVQAVGAAVRYETSFSDRARELAILVVAHRWESDFEWYAHVAVGRHVGLTDAELASVRMRDYSGLTDREESVVASVADALSWAGDLEDAAYAEAVSVLGQTQLFELITLVGYYSALALQLRVFRVAAPEAEILTEPGAQEIIG
jgi:4-carboxymuconolactone decarboxylase